MRLTEDEAEDIVFGDNIAIQDVSDHRWYTKQLVVYRNDDGKLRGFYYLDPASELQEDMDRFDEIPVPTFAVEGHNVTTTIYRAK